MTQDVRIFDPIAKARANPKSLRLAINAKCWECVGAGADVNPRGEIRACTVTRCSLHQVRPYQTKEDETEEQEAA